MTLTGVKIWTNVVVAGRPRVIARSGLSLTSQRTVEKHVVYAFQTVRLNIRT